MSVVCLDTQVIRWGVMKEESKTPQGTLLISRAIHLIELLEQQKASVILPSIVVGELLVTVPERDHPAVLDRLNEDWLIVDYDLRAAQLFAKIRKDQVINQIMDEIRQGNPYATRRQLSADIMIVATAIAHGAEKIYSHDKDFLKLAAPHIDAIDFMSIPVQTSFLESIEPQEE